MQDNSIKRSRAFPARAIAALCAALIVAAPGGGALASPAETVLYSFMGLPSDGANPNGGLIADSSGNLYGTTSEGGTGSGCFSVGSPPIPYINFGCGVVFKLTPGGTETVLYNFTGGSDGKVPTGGLIADSGGNLYGTTFAGGAWGRGAVFKLTPGGTETVLHSFSYNFSDGANPTGRLIADGSGNLYGTTQGGGASNNGMVFKLSPDGTETVLYSFTGGSDGGSPGRLIADSSGNLYGTAGYGGALQQGVVFKLSPGGTETVLYNFTGGSDGANPNSDLIADGSGNLYGTAGYGGVLQQGVVFKLSPGGTETVLHSFTGGSDGGNPSAGLIADGSGNLYGTTYYGGAPGSGCFGRGCGVVFKLTPGGTETVLYSFAGSPSDGVNPNGDLIADGSGNLYGTANGGALGQGVVFELAGTGFVPGIPFLAFNAALEISFGSAPNQDALVLGSALTLSSTAPAINPVAQPVTLQVGNFTATIPPGSFINYSPGSWSFEGVIFGGVALQVFIETTGTLRYAFYAGAWNAPSLTGTTNPVPVTLTIGPDTGTISVTAYIVTEPAAAAAHRR